MKVGIAGFGTIGSKVAATLDRGIEGLTLCGVFTRSGDAARNTLATFRNPVPVLPIEKLAAAADVIVECVPAGVFLNVAPIVIAHGKVLVTVSAAALLDHPELVTEARLNGARIILATGALLGLDAVRAAAEGTVHSVRMVTRKPPRSLADAAVVRESGFDLTSLQQPCRLFAGSARQGARLFPANVNVAAALGLAGIGPDRTELEIWADPACTRNTHTIIVEADSARFEMRIENVPSEENPSTAKITALSVVACLRSLVSTLRVGT
jgi:aspartate dehydrogenase